MNREAAQRVALRKWNARICVPLLAIAVFLIIMLLNNSESGSMKSAHAKPNLQQHGR